MSAISMINNITNQISGSDDSAKKTQASNDASEKFETILDSTIKDASSVAIINPTTIQNSFEEVFNELGINIATSLVSALSGTNTTTDKTAEDEENGGKSSDLVADDSLLTTEDNADNAQVSENKETDIKNIFDSLTSLSAKNLNLIKPDTRNALLSLQNILIESDDDAEKQTKS